MSEALGLVNQVRGRSQAPPLSEITYENLLVERALELYAEGFRRSDRIRFGVYYDTRWEKDNIDDSHVSIWPIPEAQMNVNPNLIQNTGY